MPSTRFARSERPLTAFTPVSRKVSQLLHQLRDQADARARNDELHAVLKREHSWLEQAQRTIEEARRWRELEMQWFWPGLWRRWALALVFALARRPR